SCSAASGVELDSEHLSSDHQVVPMVDGVISLDAYVGAVARVEIGQGKAIGVLFDDAVLDREMRIRVDVHVAALASDRDAASARAVGEPGRAPLQELHDSEGAVVNGGGVEVGTGRVGFVGNLGHGLDAKQLITREE